MKRKSSFLVFLIAVGLIFNLAGCDEDGNNGNNDVEEDELTASFQSFTPPSIMVENKTGERLVAFKGSLNPNNLISGIPAHATNHGLEKKTSLFSSSGDFTLILINESEFNKNKTNIAAAEIFATIYAFYNHEATNNNVFRISSKVGGAGRIILNNPTPWNVEIRKDSPTGEVLGYVASQLTGTVLRLAIPDDYNLFPVFKRYNYTDKEIYEIIPKYTAGHELLIGRPYTQTFALSNESPQTWDFNELASTLNFSISSGGIYIRVQNDSGIAIRFARGSGEFIEELTTSTGIKGIQQTYTNIYNIKIPRNPDGTYPDKQIIKGYSIGTSQLMLPIPEQEYKTDYIYTIRVTGANAAELVLGDVEESTVPMDLEAKFGGN